MYEVDPSVREVLLVDLIERVEDGAHRLRRLADFLLAYLDRTGPGQRPEVRRAHQWIAWSYLAPEKVVDDMSALLTEISPGSGVAPALAHQLEVATMVEIVREPLERASLRTPTRTWSRPHSCWRTIGIVTSGSSMMWSARQLRSTPQARQNPLLQAVARSITELERAPMQERQTEQTSLPLRREDAF